MSVTRICPKRKPVPKVCFNNLIRINTVSSDRNSNLRLKLGLLNIRSLTNKAVIVNEMITDNRLHALCLTETWIRPGDYLALNEATPPGYSHAHRSRPNGRGGGVATIFDKELGVTAKSHYKAN